MSALIDPAVIETTLRRLLDARAPGASICPSEVARALADDAATWRPYMPLIRDVAARLAHAGELQITRRGHVLAPDALEAGPIRISKRVDST